MINWYPGHMASARRMLEENLKIIDAAIVMLDARLPYSSRNPDLDKLLKNKKQIFVLNKSDLADPAGKYGASMNLCLVRNVKLMVSFVYGKWTANQSIILKKEVVL